MCSVHSTPRGKPWVKSVPELPMDALHGGKLRSFASLNKGGEGSLRRHFSGLGGGLAIGVCSPASTYVLSGP